MGDLLSIVVHAANIHVTESGINPVKQAFEKYPTIRKFCGDDGYRKSFEEDMRELPKLGVDISERITPGWAVLPKRWIVERTLGWLGHSRRLSKDYEIRTDSAGNMVVSPICTLCCADFDALNTGSDIIK